MADIQRPVVVLAAMDSHFSGRDTLKQRGWSWHDLGQFWFTLVAADGIDSEVAWITASRSVIGGCPSRAEIPVLDRFANSMEPWPQQLTGQNETADETAVVFDILKHVSISSAADFFGT